jgi:CheY-like chemotaxis protein
MSEEPVIRIVVIIDYHLPDIDGTDAIKTLREVRPTPGSSLSPARTAYESSSMPRLPIIETMARNVTQLNTDPAEWTKWSPWVAVTTPRGCW